MVLAPRTVAAGEVEGGKMSAAAAAHDDGGRSAGPGQPLSNSTPTAAETDAGFGVQTALRA